MKLTDEDFICDNFGVEIKKALIDKTILSIPDMEKHKGLLLCEAQLKHAIPIIADAIVNDLIHFIFSKIGVDCTGRKYISPHRKELSELIHELEVYKKRYF